MKDERGLVGILVFFIFIGFAAIYLMVAAPLFDGLDSSPIVQSDSFSDSDAMIDGSGPWSKMKTVGLIGVPLLLISTGVVYAYAYYTRRERAGGRLPGGRI